MVDRIDGTLEYLTVPWKMRTSWEYRRLLRESEQQRIIQHIKQCENADIKMIGTDWGMPVGTSGGRLSIFCGTCHRSVITRFLPFTAAPGLLESGHG